MNNTKDFYVECWLEVNLYSGDALVLHPINFDLVHSSVTAFKKRNNSDLIQVVIGDEILELTRIEGGCVYVPISSIDFYALITPEEAAQKQDFCNWVNNLTPWRGQ